jgi:4-hydroxythreonine-4-phosphate dehydrogenase
MKVYVCQGHEKGIGLEVFFKSCLFFSPDELAEICLIAFSEEVTRTLSSLCLPFKLEEDAILLAHVRISVFWMQKIDHSQSFSALQLAMMLSESGGVLFTLPTSKDQFPGFAGHTEFFRHFYHRPELGMFFSAPNIQMLLITDHVPVKKLPEILTTELLFNSLRSALQTLKSWNWPVGEVLVAGLNPHAGEGGIIGEEDKRVSSAIKRLSDKGNFKITGPYPADTMLGQRRESKDLLVYLYHDQGLALFKGLEGFMGSNITLGLPYPRFSPDHGTSFSLFGKNCADYRGCQFSLRQALWMLRRVYGQHSSYKSKSS